MFNLNSIVTKFASNLPLYGVIGLTAMTSGIASFKLLNNDSKALSGDGSIAQISTQETSDNSQGKNDDVNQALETDNTYTNNDATYDSGSITSSNDYYPVANPKKTVQVNVNSTVPGVTFTIDSLALHNKPGDCYVAFNGVVYDVSNHPSWLSCNHHGIVGGIDITSRFPHSTSYFNTLPKVGSLIGGSTSTGSGTGSGSGQEQESEQESKDDQNEKNEVNKDGDSRDLTLTPTPNLTPRTGRHD